MPRESGTEQRGNEILGRLGWWQVKVGFDGWPDRLVVWAPGRHFWVEWKQLDGSLTSAQRVRIPRMLTSGEPVFIPRSQVEFIELLEILQ